MRISGGSVNLADVTDRAARLLGVVYGSQAQQLLQRAVSFDLQTQIRSAGVEIDPRDVSDRITRDVGWTGDRWLRELRASRAFAGAFSQTAVVAERSHAQLMNPAASGKTAIVYAVVVHSSATSEVNIAHYDTALTTDGGAQRNLLSGGAASVCHIRTQSNAAGLGAVIARRRFVLNTVADFAAFQIGEIGAGLGLACWLDTVNLEMQGHFFWIEV